MCKSPPQLDYNEGLLLLNTSKTYDNQPTSRSSCVCNRMNKQRKSFRFVGYKNSLQFLLATATNLVLLDLER